MKAIGIDLGTSYSCVAVWRNNWVDVIADGLGNRTTPSYVAFTDSGRLIGEVAQSQAAMNPTNTVYGTKRLIGKHIGDKYVEDDMTRWPFKVCARSDGKLLVEVQYKGEERKFAPEQIAGMLLLKLRNIAEANLGCEVNSAVVSVPVKFNEFQRQATKYAAFVAGLKSLQFVNETSAAATAYCLEKRNDNRGKVINLLVFNLGGGTLDVSLFRTEGNVIETKASTGDIHLGGEDFNNRLVDYFVDNFKRKYNKDISGNARKMRKLMIACEKAKRALSSATQTAIEIDFLFDDKDFFANITRSKFEEINVDLFARCMDTVEECLRESRTDKSEVDEIVLVGGSTRIPKLRELLQDYFHGKELCKSINPDEAVACGAAVLAEAIFGDETIDWVLQDVTSHSFGLEVGGEFMNVVIPKNTTLPASKCQIFTTFSYNSYDHFKELIPLNDPDGTRANFSYPSEQRNNSYGLRFKVYEGEMPNTIHNNLLAQIELPNFSPDPTGRPEIMITFSIDEAGILAVYVKEMITGIQHRAPISANNLRSNIYEVMQMAEQAEEFQAEEEVLTMAVESKNALENYAYCIRNSVKVIQDEVEKTITWLESNQSAEAENFDNRMEELKNLCKRLINNA